MQNSFDDILRESRPVESFGDVLAKPRADIAPVQQTYLPWQEVIYRFVSNIPRSALENVRDAAMLVRPVGKAAHGDSTAVFGDYTAFPGLQDLGALVGQAGIAGVEKATGTEILKDKKVLDGLIEFYRANYGLGPEGIKGFERFITEDPVGFLTDLMMFASVGSAAPSVAVRGGKRAGATAKAFRGLRESTKPAPVGEAFTRAWKEGKSAVAYENYAPFVVKVDHVLNRGFAVPSRLQGLFRSIPIVRGRLTDVPVSFGPRAGTTDTGFQMGLAEIGDPAAHVLRGTLGRAGRMLGSKLKAREPAASAAERRDVDLPLSGKAVSPAAAAAEAVRLKRDDPEMHARVMGVYEGLDRIAQETINSISEASDADVAANLAVQGYERYQAEFRKQMDDLYDSIEDLGTLPAVLTHTKAFFDQFAQDAAQGEPLTGRQEYSPLLHSIRENVEAYAEQYPEIVGPDGRLMGGDEGGGAPPGPTGKGDTPEDTKYRREKRGGKSRMVKGNWGHKYQAEYALVELEDLIQSNLPDGTPNPDYDPNLQPRDRSDASSRLQVEEMAKNLDPDLLLDDTSAMNDGAPIIGDDLMVESGNGRIMAMKMAAANPVLAYRLDAYKRQLMANLDEYGLSADDVGNMRHAVLVRRRTTDVDRTEFVKEANEASGKSFRAGESAIQDARFMNAELMQLFSFGDEASLRAALKAGRNNAFVNGYVSKFPNDKQGAFFDKSGTKLTDEGYARIERAMLLSVFDNTFGAIMAGRFADLGDEGMVNIRKGIYGALPEMAQLKYRIESGERRADLAFFEDVAQAVLKVRDLTEQGRPASWARDQGRFEWDEVYDDLTDDAARILLMIERGKQAPSELTEFLRWYARQVDAQPNEGQGALFESAPVTKAEILQTALGQRFEDIPDISDLRGAVRGDAPIESKPEPPFQRDEAHDKYMRQTWDFYDADWNRFESYVRGLTKPGRLKYEFGFATPEEVLAHAQKMVDEGKWVTPEQIETRVDELRIAVRKGDFISLKDREFDSYRELAVLSQALRDPTVEWSHVFYVREMGDGIRQVIGHETTTLGSGMMTRPRGYKALQAQMEALQADGMVFLHNHPGADASFSKGDLDAHQARESVLGQAYLGDLVINSGSFAFHVRNPENVNEFWTDELMEFTADDLSWDPAWGTEGFEKQQPHIRTNDPMFEEAGALAEGWGSGEQFNFQYTSPQDIIKNLGGFGRQLKIDNNWVVLNMVSSWNRLNSVVQVRGDQLAAMDVRQRATFLRELAQTYGGEQVHVFVGKGDYYSNQQQAWELFSSVNDQSDGGGIMSVMVHGQKSGWVNEEPEFYNRSWKAQGLQSAELADQMPRAAEHMTQTRETFESIKRDGVIKGSDRSVFRRDADDRVWFSSGGYYRLRSMNNGFLFDPKVLHDKYSAVPGDMVWYKTQYSDEFSALMKEADYPHDDSQAYVDLAKRFMDEKGITASDVLEDSGFSAEMTVKGDIDLKDAIGEVVDGELKIITEATRGKPADQWEFREPTEAELRNSMETQTSGAYQDLWVEGKPEPRGLPQTRDERLPELMFDNVKRTRTIVGDALFSKNPDPIVSREERFYKMLYDALTADLTEAVERHAPERAGEFEEISRRYAEGHDKINKGWGLKILRSAQKGEQEKLVNAIFKSDMPVEQIPLVYELFGGKESEGGRAMQSAFIRELLKKSKSADGAWLPQSLRRQLNAHGDKRLRAFFDDETVSALNDMADISLGMADFAKMAHGSQTAFLAREMLEGSMFGGALQKLAWRIGTGPVGWFLMFADLVGQEAATRFFTSPEGEAFLLRGGVRTAVGEGMQWLTEGAQGQLARGANRAIEE